MPEFRRPYRGFRSATLCMRWLILAVACVVFSAASATERQDQQSEALRALLTTLETALDSAASRDLSAAVLIRQAGLVDYVSASKVQLVPVLPVAQALPEPVLGQRLDLRPLDDATREKALLKLWPAALPRGSDICHWVKESRAT